ncbi:hypothetical protein OQA88_13441 [Cercophora sp. LCS_1]
MVLGIEIESSRKTCLPQGRGGFGVCLTSNKFKATSVLRLVHRADHPSLANTRGGSKHSILFAKHIACGCIPFSRNNEDNEVQTLSVTKQVCDIIRQGGQICDGCDYEGNSGFSWAGRQIQYLNGMPAFGDTPNYYFMEHLPSHPAASAVLRSRPYDTGSCFGHPRPALVLINDDRHSSDSLSQRFERVAVVQEYLRTQRLSNVSTIWSSCKQGAKPWLITTWPRVVAGIAFGGLVPVTTAPVADIVRFSVGDCLTDMNQGERDMRAMERLMTLVQEGVYKRADQWIPLFGGKFLDRPCQKSAADHVDYGSQALGVFDEDMTDTVRHMGQYTTLLEALIARIDGKTLPHADNPFEKGAIKRKAVFDACVSQIEGLTGMQSVGSETTNH